MLWVDKHRPTQLKNLSYHPDTTARLESLAAAPANMPHLLFYGPPGAGKKTRINALLRAIYGPGAERLRLDKRTFTTPTKRTVDINMISSNYHIEMSPGDAGINDRFVVQDVIKEMAANKSLSSAVTAVTTHNASQESSSSGTKKTQIDFKVVVLVEVDKLSRQAQAALRRTMEKYSTSCRLILCCNNQSKVIDPVRSRCLGIRIAAPTHDDICQVLKATARKESIILPDELAVNIARQSSRNMRRAMLMLESCHVQSRDATGGTLSAHQPVQKTDWELYITQLASEITREQSPQRLMAAREKLYELLINCIPADVIIKNLAFELMKNLDDSLKHEVIEWAAFYEHRIATGSKDIFHLEAFVAKYMAIYKRYLNEMFA
uniref:AAA+ ATPase domain-containing protein n=1 Tax=Attheya septentrionalis TaxID=420275 RepID=A0A7S2U7C3_9STRA|mmetsp:Transcript_13529/g.24504  ORF Transcript_13529/g.24504 Transcript_13529/m.24504 type:complete len:378 (+) Transcript_13529:109-1242(+)|eukprot:CAMPEP_0198290326 /NCGR_PEP_ID=MMETSP1449-20131203/8245_1 /TAXON_ID=420275 /ORGANISM="Attheya septentrionalis, Strain CCMP2084" /LENGTH=377 /DNA_ID=CAMNT_0043988827 /DNA_START=27 /DNA_END=1160 /DNA_ORIENTATION=+